MKEFVSEIAAVAVTGMFLFYLTHRDKKISDVLAELSDSIKTINDCPIGQWRDLMESIHPDDDDNSKDSN